MRIVAQRAEGDCGVAALSTLLGAAYEDVYVAVARINRRRGKRGLCNKDLIQAAAHLGVTLKPKRKADLDEDAGILNVLWNGKYLYRGHFVVLYNGMIVDPAGPQVLPYEEWFRFNPARPATLLTEA